MDVEIRKTMRRAIKSGDLRLVKDLLATYHGLKDTVTGYGTWLHVASDQGQLDIVKYLIEIGLDVNQNGGFADSGAIREASFNGHLDVVQYLYEHGARLDVSTATRNPLYAAIYNGQIEVVKYLVENGIDIVIGYDIGSLKNADACEYARHYGQTKIVNYLKDRLLQK
jgi:uncharacterized protein